MPPHNDPLLEGERLFTICNACRYCEGYCAVYPAMERRLTFPPQDLRYLANLCHNCTDCLSACQYAPPHEFAVNIPQTLARIRLQSYEHHASPRLFAAAFRSNTLATGLLTALAVLFFFLFETSRASAPDFYSVIPYNFMVAVFTAAAAFALVALALSSLRFWRESGQPLTLRAFPTALRDALTLKYLCSGGPTTHSNARRRFHHLTSYGFALCFASTCTAALYSNAFHREPPYSYTSLPVILGALGGFGLILGPAGLFALKLKRNPATSDPAQSPLDYTFLAMLFLASLTGLILLALRGTHAMPILLPIHLGAVLALFLTLPYGKFVHATYRFAALLRNALEARRGSLRQESS